MSRELSEPGGKLRLFVEQPLAESARVTLSPEQAHYLLHVMRGKPGDRVSLFNGKDGEWRAQVAEVGKRACVLQCESRTRAQTDVPDIWLCFAPVKKTPADYLTQKATELGARLLQPVMTRRTIVTRVNLERLRANAAEAAEQSERLTVPEIREPLSLDRMLAGWPQDRRLIFCDEAGDAPPLADALREIDDQPCAILTGPEGGFDPQERDMIRAHRFALPVSLGLRILRADTAALAALAIWQSIKGDWR